jgi:hypothetical protein
VSGDLRARVRRLEADPRSGLAEARGLLATLGEALAAAHEGRPVDPARRPLIERWAVRPPGESMVTCATVAAARAALAGDRLNLDPDGEP